MPIPIDPTDIHELTKAAADALRPKNEWAEVAKTALWPAVAALGLVIYRRPLRRFFEGLGQRVTGLSVLNVVSVELSSATSRPFSFAEVFPAGFGDPSRGEFNSSSVMHLVQQIAAVQQIAMRGAPYSFIVNIGEGRRWLISRVFLFTFILLHLRAIHCVVFVETRGELKRRLLGLADPQAVYTTLARRYPWFERALLAAWAGPQLVPNELRNPGYPGFGDVLSWLGSPHEQAPWLAERFINLRSIQRTEPPPADQTEEWEETRTGVWERTKWLTSERVDDLRAIFFDRDESCLIDLVDKPVGERNKALLRRKSPFIALVNEHFELKQVVDRAALMDSLADALKKEEA